MYSLLVNPVKEDIRITVLLQCFFALRIKEAMKRKDEKTNQMRGQFERELEKQVTELDQANRRVEHLEELLDQQRKQLLQSLR
ncbi:unnamed protein product [Echinostoma caproni]|uniref:BZIP domain-containing protein n=1 Tax=Echinostoma caproni TaxID=27848 RepID=A0A183BEG1_9TREM|nr:unnamed protein product [Echinostoma caproni]